MIPAWQLHATFIAISTQPPSSRSFSRTAHEPGWPVSVSRAIQGPFPWPASPERCEGSVGAWTWCWDGASPQELPSSQDHQQSSTEQQTLQRRIGIFYLSCSPSSCSTPGGMPGRPDLYRDFWQADCRVTKAGLLKSKANNTQETTARQSFCRR